MHTLNDTRTRDNTLALYGAKHRGPAYRAIRATVRTLIVATPSSAGSRTASFPRKDTS